jgi:hypothetical protein
VRSGFGLPPGAPHTRLPPTRTGLIALGVLLAACASRGSPATTPATVATTLATSTTLDRLAEVQAIVQDLEERRLDALYRKDLEALRELYASEGLYELEVELTLPEIEFKEPPGVPEIRILELLKDDDNCLAAEIFYDASEFVTDIEPITIVTVLQQRNHGWGFAYSGEGWLCDGRNPMDEPST